MMSDLLQNKVALISGAARGQGAAAARLFVESGARVVLGDVLDDEGEHIAESLGESARYVHLDVTNQADWRAAVAAAQAQFGALNILINNAGVDHSAPIEDISYDDYMRIIHVNQVGTFLGMQAATPALKAAGGGSIVNTSSLAGLMGLSHKSAYTASKWAVRGMTKAIAMELGRYGIRVNAVFPGAVNTPMIQDADGQVESGHFQHLAIARVGEPEEIARLLRFIASDECSYTTGSDFVVDGGMSQGFVLDS